jgi:plasmid stabilization system protein ParE
MSAVHISPAAADDLSEIKRYIADELQNPTAAASTVGKILKSVGTLADFPEIGAPLSSVVDIDTAYRFLVCGKYLAFYYVESGDAFVVRILYGRRDYVRILFGDRFSDDE